MSAQETFRTYQNLDCLLICTLQSRCVVTLSVWMRCNTDLCHYIYDEMLDCPPMPSFRALTFECLENEGDGGGVIILKYSTYRVLEMAREMLVEIIDPSHWGKRE